MTTINAPSRLDMNAILIGTFIALAVSIVLLEFGAAIGLSSETAFDADISLLSWNVVAVGIWLLWVQLIAAVLGGYAAGFLRTPHIEYKVHVNEVIDGFYGLSVWALSTIAMTIGVSVAALVTTVLAVDQTEGIQETLSNAEENSLVIYAFVLGATSLVSAAASWWAATVGGDHRFKETDFSKQISFRKIV